MKIHMNHIRWETDDIGTSRATMADKDHNSLTLENRDDGTISIHTDGTPRFELSAILDITALFAILSRKALAEQVSQGHGAADVSADSGTSVVVPGQRQAPVTEHHSIDSR
jgi:hypothetical protein